ncbi:MAG TPA: AarF/UbiB family protein [Pyrinomonadaceae bacterium]|jgi:ubiquinone biosynthesis protein
MSHLILDTRRGLLLVRKLLKFSLPVLFRRVFRGKDAAESYAVPLRHTLEELGMTYLKLGQYLAMRFDILPEEVCDELNRLFEEVRPLAYEEVKVAVESELGGPLERFFANFERQHIAAASVAQVHRATMLDGTEVAVKVQRPGIDRIFESDMRILGALSDLSDKMRLAGKLSARDVFDQFAKWTRRELNFITEGETAVRLREHAEPHEVVPEIYWSLTTRKVITMEYIDGISMGQVAKLLDKGGIEEVRKHLPDIDLEEALHNLSNASMHQLFLTGFFHGDPHPGNILVLRDNSVAFVDFGIFGELSRYQREVLANHIENLALGNIKESFRYYTKLGVPSEDTDMRAFEREGEASLRAWYSASRNLNTSIQERHLGKVSGEVTAVVRKYQYLINAETLLFWRAINALDSTALRLDPQFDLLGELRRFFEDTRPTAGERIADLVTDRELAGTLVELNSNLSGYLNNILSDLTRGEYSGSVVLEESGDDTRLANRVARWSSASVVALSFVVLAVPANFPPLLRASSLALAALLLTLSLAKLRFK